MPSQPNAAQDKALKALVADKRYWNDRHPEHAAYVASVNQAFADAYGSKPAPGQAANASTAPGTPGGQIHVRTYTRMVNGKTVEVQAHDRTSPWHGQSHEKLRDMIAREEGSSDKANHGYGEKNPESGALGRYQLKPDALLDAKWRNADGSWTKKAEAYGVKSDADFLRSPAAQEAALSDVFVRDKEQLQANGSLDHVGQQVHGLQADFTLSEESLLAAAHREGAGATHTYLTKMNRAGWDSKKANLSDGDKHVETRLRTFHQNNAR